MVFFSTRFSHRTIRGKQTFQVDAIFQELDKDQDGKLQWQEHLDDLHYYHQPPEDADSRA